MLVPLKDDKALKYIPFQLVTVMIISVCVITFTYQVSQDGRGGQAVVYAFGLIPSVLWAENQLAPSLELIPAWLTPVTSMFLHGGFWHLLFNMLFLWVFGDNVEDATGHLKFLVFYLVCGIAGALAHAIFNAGSAVPMIGASGAVSGVIAAYFMLHPRAKVWCLVFKIPIKLPAFLMLGVWIAYQFYNVAVATDNGTAWWAHVGGLVAGAVLIPFFKHPQVRLFDRADQADDTAAPAAGPMQSRPTVIPSSGPQRSPWRRR